MVRKRLTRTVLASAGAAVLLVLVCGMVVISLRSPDDNVVQMVPTFTVWPGTAYDHQNNVPDATGTVKATQPEGNDDVMIAVCVEGLLPNTQYIVKLDTNGNGSNYDSLGPWVQAGDFQTDENGRAEWTYTAPAGTYTPGTYTQSIFINLARAQQSILVSRDIVFTIGARQEAEPNPDR